MTNVREYARVLALLGACLAPVSCSDGENAASSGPRADGAMGNARRDAGHRDASLDVASPKGRDASTGVRRDASLDGAAPPPFGYESRPANTSCFAPKRPSNEVSVALVWTYQSLPAVPQPLGFYQAPNDASRSFIMLQRGIVYAIENKPDVTQLPVFVNIQARVNFGPDEAGLLGMAFDPNFATNGIVYVSYTAHGGAIDLTSRISRFRSKDGGKTLDPNSEEILLSLEQPYQNHNGGNIQFGPDGFLYIGFGDGGSAGDPQGNGQNRNVLLGKLLRIDVSAAGPYTIPKTNPFAAGGGKPEIFALGFRNPWRWSFDRGTGDLWVGDVGQGSREEVDLVKRGGNYGWRRHEGFLCINQPPCPFALDPIADYPHTDGLAVIGGFVYRGTAIPQLVGTYLYADYVTAKIWALFRDPKTGTPTPTVIATAPSRITSFGQGADGEVYVTQYQAGTIAKLIPIAVRDGGADAGASPPATLSASGCVDPSDPTKLAKGVIPYDVNMPYWADGTELSRGVAIPDGTKVKVGADGRFDLPNGTVLIQTASKNGRRLDTKLLVRHDDGDWTGYSYAWNEAQTDATLLRGPLVVGDGSFSTYVTHPGECLACHTTGSGRVLGFNSRELNRDFSYPNGARLNQLVQFEHIGLFDSSLDASTKADAFPSVNGTDPVDARARAYLDVNCAMCHRPGGSTGGIPDLRFDTPIEKTGLCRVKPQHALLDASNALLLAPGSPEQSVLSLRMHRDDWSRMPPFESRVVDADGTELIDQWIASPKTGCPAPRTDGGG